MTFLLLFLVFSLQIKTNTGYKGHKNVLNCQKEGILYYGRYYPHWVRGCGLPYADSL